MLRVGAGASRSGRASTLTRPLPRGGRGVGNSADGAPVPQSRVGPTVSGSRKATGGSGRILLSRWDPDEVRATRAPSTGASAMFVTRASCPRVSRRDRLVSEAKMASAHEGKMPSTHLRTHRQCLGIQTGPSAQRAATDLPGNCRELPGRCNIL